MVTLLATVRDRNGTIINSLNKEDFIVEEDGVTQTIRYFSRISDLPLTLGLLVDTSKSEARSIESERGASYTFLDKMLRENDRAFVAHFDFRVGVLQDLTSSRTLLASALDKLAIPKRSSTLLYDAVRECAEAQMRKQQGRKAFIVLSDGVDVHSKTTITTAIEFAQRVDTIIYSILFNKGPAIADPGSAVLKAIVDAKGKRAMKRLAEETGGKYFEVSKNNSIEKIYASIEEELRNQYSIGYTPDRKAECNRYRKVRLTTRQPRLLVQSRAGYYGE